MTSATPTALDALAADLLAQASVKPVVGVVLGSGLGTFGDQLAQCISYENVPGMPVSRIPGHPGNLRFGRIDGIAVACLQGRVHLYEGHSPDAVVFGVRLLARLGCRAVVLTNAAGGIGSHLGPGDRMLVTDHLNLTGQNPLTGTFGDALGPRFIDMGKTYDPRLMELARAAARDTGTSLQEGVYAGVLGPSYETPAEIRMFRTMGADAVGMSTVLEVIALRQLEVRVAAISCITNLAAGLSKMPLDHYEVQEIARQTSGPFVALLSRFSALVGNELRA